MEDKNQIAATAYQNGYQNALNELLKDCMPSPSLHTDVCADGPKMASTTRNLIHLKANKRPFPREELNEWKAPVFQDARAYIIEALRTRKSHVPLGTFDSNSIKLSLKGHILCSGEGEDDLREVCILRIVKDGKVEAREVYVLGSVSGRGTAALLDTTGNVWLYNPPNAIDPHITGMEYKAALVLPEGECASLGSEIQFREVYDEVELINLNVEDDPIF